jgi:hypothetical protein
MRHANITRVRKILTLALILIVLCVRPACGIFFSPHDALVRSRLPNADLPPLIEAKQKTPRLWLQTEAEMLRLQSRNMGVH